MLLLTVLNNLQSQGWAELDFASSDSDCTEILRFAATLGSPTPSRFGGPLVDILRIRSEMEASPWSLSAKFGKGMFPFHTDQAKLLVPPRYIILRCRRLKASRRPTLIHDFKALDLSCEEEKALSRSIWVVGGGRGCFLTSVLTSHSASGESLIRFDTNCMKPAHPKFYNCKDILGKALSRTKPIKVNWYEGLGIVLDNWRILHARSNNEISCTESSSHCQETEEREIERVLITSNIG